MTIPLRRPLTVDEYVGWAHSQSERQRTELINGQIVTMAPERVEHGEIKLAAAIALRTAIAKAGCDCHVLGDGMTVRIDEHTAYEPDALAYCGPRLARGSTIVPDPVIIVEVLSPATAHRYQREADRLLPRAERHTLSGRRSGWAHRDSPCARHRARSAVSGPVAPRSARPQRQCRGLFQSIGRSIGRN